MTYLKKIIASLLVLVFFIGTLIAFVPTLINTTWGQQRVLSIVNEQIPGKVNLTNIHLSWFAGQRLEGVVLKDPTGQVVVSIDKVLTDSSLWKLLTRDFDLSGLQIQELNGSILLNASGHTNLQEALIANLPPKASTIVPSQAPLLINHVNAKFGQLSSRKPLSMHLQGQTQQGNLKGLVEVDILLNEMENAHIKAKITGFPVDILDDIISLNKPALSGMFRVLLGDQLNLTIDDTISQQGQSFDLAFSTANVEGSFIGMMSDHEIRLIQPGMIKMKATPELFDQLIAYATPSADLTLKKTTELKLQVDDLSWPLGDNAKNDTVALKAVAQINPTDLTSSEQNLLSFDTLKMNLDVAQKSTLEIAASGNYRGEAFDGQASFFTTTPHSPLGDIQGSVIFSSFPTQLVGMNDIRFDQISPIQITINKLTLPASSKENLVFDLLIKNEGLSFTSLSSNKQTQLSNFQMSVKGDPFKKVDALINLNIAGVPSLSFLGREGALTADLSMGIRGDNSLHIDRLFVNFQGTENSLLNFQIDPLKLNLQEFTLASLNMRGLVQIENARLPDDVAINNLQMPWEFNAEANRVKMNLLGSVGKGTEKASPLKGTVLVENWLNKGKFDAAAIKVNSDIKVEKVPAALFNAFASGVNIEDLIGEAVDLSLIGSFDLGKQIPGTMDVAVKSPNLRLEGQFLIENGSLKVKENNPLAITWTLTPKNWSYLRKSLLKTPNDQERLRLNENTPLSLQITSLYIPFKQSNAFVDNGVQATLIVKQLNVTDKKTNEVLHINNIQANIGTWEQTDAIHFSVSADPSIRTGGNTKFILKGDVKNLFDGAGKFDTSQISCEMKADCKQVPVGLVGVLFALDDATQARIKALIGEELNADADINVQQMTGLVKADVYGDLGQATLDGQVKKGFLTLNKPLVFQVKVTPQLGKTILNDFVPFLSSAIGSSEPIRIQVDPKGFSMPLSNFNIQQTQIPYMTLSLGKVDFLNKGELKTILNLLKAGNREQLSIWFTPLYVRLQDGVINCNRMDMLVADEYPLAIWGNVDLNKDRVRMMVGLGEPALRKAFGIRGLDKHYLMQMPLTGTTGNVKIDQARAATYIAALIAQMQKLPAGDILGTVLQIAGSGFSDPTPPEPTTKPLPWDNQFNDDTPKESKNPAKVIPKAANEVIKEVEKGASKLIKNLFR